MCVVPLVGRDVTPARASPPHSHSTASVAGLRTRPKSSVCAGGGDGVCMCVASFPHSSQGCRRLLLHGSRSSASLPPPESTLTYKMDINISVFLSPVPAKISRKP